MGAVTKSFLGFLLVAVFVVVPSSASAESTCSEAQEKIQAWIEAQGPNLPTNLKELSKHPMAYRRAIFVALPAEKKVALWQEHVRHYIATHPQLSSRQVDVLDSILEMLTPKAYLEPGSFNVSAATAAAAGVFSVDEVRVILATLGPVEEPAAVPLELAPLCACSAMADFCFRSECRVVAMACLRTAMGCGLLGLSSCDGLCYSN
ncbi:bacteriocin fulvocin C-related protein [Myxococcus fulvus]|uniref:bacteriocin fulvocin C-related protein n=1 Tax=Myxococcus fulvus TaxID=33 RepID=UPI003B9A2BC2